MFQKKNTILQNDINYNVPSRNIDWNLTSDGRMRISFLQEKVSV